MSNCMMGFPNRTDKATLSGGAWTAGLPRANLQDRVIGRVARTVDATLASTQFNMDMGPTGKARALSFRKHNFSLAARYRVRATGEGVKKNLISYPRESNGAAWARANMAVLPGAALAPDGTMTAERQLAISTGTGAVYTVLIAITPGATYTCSRYFKAGTAPLFELGFSDQVDSGCTMRVDTATRAISGGAFGGWTGFSGRVDDAGGGWYRAVLTATNTAGDTATAVYGCHTSGGGPSLTAGQYGWTWHAQMIEGASPGPIIPDLTQFVSRAGIKNEFNAAGVLTQYAAGAAVTAYDPATLISRGLSLEAATTNRIRNNTMVGAVAGTPGTLPTNWRCGVAPGLSYSVVGTGVESGIEYIDLLISGAATVTGGVSIFPDDWTYITEAVSGEIWTNSGFIRLVAGSLANIVSQYLVIEEYSLAGVFVTGFSYAHPAPTAAPLSTQRVSATRTLSGGPSTARVGGYFGFAVTTGAAVNITLRIGLPQLVQGALATSPIKTTGAVVTRAADISISPQGTLPAGYMDELQPATYDSDWMDVWPTVYPFGTLEWGDENWWSGKYTTEEAEGYIAELVHILPSDRYERWWRIEFDDQTNAAGFIEIGRLFIGPVWQPKLNMSYDGASIGWETTTEARQAISGAEYFSDGINYRVQRFTLGHMKQDEAFSQAFELQRRAGISGEILWIHDPTDTVHALRRRFLARLRQLSPIEYPYPLTNSTAFELKELL